MSTPSRSLAPSRSSSLAPSRRGQSLRPRSIAPARRCARHKLVLRPDGTCVVCDREGGPFASDVSGLRGRTVSPERPGEPRGSLRGWLALGLAFGLVGGLLLWFLFAGPSRSLEAEVRYEPGPQAREPSSAMTSAGELPDVSAPKVRGARSGEPDPTPGRADEPADRSNPLLDAQRRAQETPAVGEPRPQPPRADSDAR